MERFQSIFPYKFDFASSLESVSTSGLNLSCHYFYFNCAISQLRPFGVNPFI